VVVGSTVFRSDHYRVGNCSSRHATPQNTSPNLPEAEHDADEWQAAMQVLNRHVERAFIPSRKDHHWGRRKLARDE
jgi:hypothetical protein